MKSSHQNHTPICPKCGYDQSGIIETWKEQCPIGGRCSECGLDFEWANVLDPSRVELAWYVEHAKSPREMIARTIPTLWYMLFPNRYWHRLGMDAPRSLKRFVLWVGAMMLLMHVLTSAGFVVTNYVGLLDMNNRTLVRMAESPPSERALYQSFLYDLSSLDYWRQIIGEALLVPIVSKNIWTNGVMFGIGMLALVSLGVSIMWFVLFSAFPTTRKRSQLRMVHVRRAMVVGGVLPMVFIEIGRVFDMMMYIGEYLSPMLSIEPILKVFTGVVVVWMFIWIQWFWIAGVRIGWKVKANWFEMFLVMLASYFGLVFAGLMMWMLQLVGMVIEMGARMVGIV